MEFALTPYDTSKETLTIKANSYEEWEEKTQSLPFEEYEVAELGDYSWIAAEQGAMEAFFEACAHFEDGVARVCPDPDLLHVAIHTVICSYPKPAYILDIKWTDVFIGDDDDLIRHLKDSYEVHRIGPIVDYIDWDACLRDLGTVGDHKSFEYAGHTFYVRGL
jgi:hypothetical protein